MSGRARCRHLLLTGGGTKVSSIARATTVTLPDTRSAKITYPAEPTLKRRHLGL